MATRTLLPVAGLFYATAAEAASASGGSVSWSVEDLIATALFGLLGIALSIAGYFVIDLVTPFSLGKELVEKQNVAVAIVVASLILGVCHVVASALG